MTTALVIVVVLIAAAARAAYVDHFVRTLPGGYRTLLDEDASKISGDAQGELTSAAIG
jgi:ATP-binding cassette subfamily B protein